ncbi:carcinoembryonic antigen-related cell adhesion molecule 1-like [Callorhinchus milii]|uniref:carcinoembryonic antigen-related cell adhesion molecule 1-like n=1 Tax=Callorhinchus milii TaxID=7868 RepID=UPI001C3FB315|nr:carcinoembryonic antigen-related cell adhesion molecule 1-like [Callorhinchus milii]
MGLKVEQVGAFSLTVTESQIEATAGQSVYFLVMPSELGNFSIIWKVNTSSTIASAKGTAVKYFGDYQGRAELYPNNATLRLDTVTPADSGSYSVSVFDLILGAASADLQLRVHTPVSNVSISLSPDKEIFIENKDTVTLRCTAMGSFPTYSWALDGHPLPVTPRYTLSADNSTLTISPVHRSDSGGFICTASHLVGSDSSKPVKLVITYGPDPLTFIVSGQVICDSLVPGQYCGKEGDLMTLNCQTKCFPECNYRWTHNTTVIAGNTSQLPIESLTFNNSGDYTCNVKNDYTTISRTEKVSILVYTLLSNVSISLSPDKEIFIENKDTTTLRCTAMGLFPTYSWALGGHPLPVTPRYTLSAANSTLTISPVHRNDSGGFICAASNPVNSDSSKPVKLVITYGPDPPTVYMSGQ